MLSMLLRLFTGNIWYTAKLICVPIYVSMCNIFFEVEIYCGGGEGKKKERNGVLGKSVRGTDSSCLEVSSDSHSFFGVFIFVQWEMR